ncbi:MAG: zinc-ribbon domain-containing protein [Alphaproteobacteria bacterium]|nr:zinc-ribbon domain-containing protein [Alphaproteobacteria bacterium]
MLIICPKCSAKYQVPEGIRLENGQKLKCSACDFVFLKGEEAPLVLDKAVQQPTESSPEVPPKAFSTPLYTSSTLNTAPADSLPEAFKPVESAPKHGGLWLIPVYILIILVLCVAGWMFRDSLQPSFGTVLPTTVSKSTVRAEKHHINPVRSVPVSNQPTVLVEEMPHPRTEPIAPTNQLINADKPIAPAEKPTVPEVSPSATVSDKDIQKKEVITPTEKIVIPTKPEIIEQNDVIQDTDTVKPITEDSEVPLFDIVVPPVIHDDVKQLNVDHLSFRIENDEEGSTQLLIEGELFNPEHDPRNIPVFTVLALDANNQVIVSKHVHVTAEQIGAGETIPFYTGITPAPTGVDHIEVRF